MSKAFISPTTQAEGNDSTNHKPAFVLNEPICDSHASYKRTCVNLKICFYKFVLSICWLVWLLQISTQSQGQSWHLNKNFIKLSLISWNLAFAIQNILFLFQLEYIKPKRIKVESWKSTGCKEAYATRRLFWISWIELCCFWNSPDYDTLCPLSCIFKYHTIWIWPGCEENTMSSF